MSDAATALRLVYGPNAAKKIARKFGIAVVTAKFWLSGRTPAARHYEIARELIAECDRLEALIADTRRRWGEVANDETARSMARRQADRNGATPRGVGRPNEGKPAVMVGVADGTAEHVGKGRG